VTPTTDIQTIDRVLLTASEFLRATNPVRFSEQPLWQGTIARLLAFFGYSEYDLREDRQKADALLSALRFLGNSRKENVIDDALNVVSFDELKRIYSASVSSDHNGILASLPVRDGIVISKVHGSFGVTAALLNSIDPHTGRPWLSDQAIYLAWDTTLAADGFMEIDPTWWRRTPARDMAIDGEYVAICLNREAEIECRFENCEFRLQRELLPFLANRFIKPITIYHYNAPYGRTKATVYTIVPNRLAQVSGALGS